MSRYLEASCKKCRNVDRKLFIKGVKCFNNCVFDKKKSEFTKKFARRRKVSDFGKHLKEKQIARFAAQINEAQFKRFYGKASKIKGKTGESFLRFLEVRLDNIVRRLGFAVSIKTARQLVSHGHIKVNGRTVKAASYIVKPNDVVTIRKKLADKTLVKQGLKHAQKVSVRPSFLSYDSASMTGKMERWPDRSEFSKDVNEQMIVEYYSK